MVYDIFGSHRCLYALPLEVAVHINPVSLCNLVHPAEAPQGSGCVRNHIKINEHFLHLSVRRRGQQNDGQLLTNVT